MVSFRTALLSCLTAVTCVAMLLAYVHTYMRYEIVGNENAVFVLDRQTTLMHRCDKDHCTLITPQGTTIESMRRLAGILSPDEIIKKENQNLQKCNCQSDDKKEILKPKIEITSFQTLDSQAQSMLRPDQIKSSQSSVAKDLGMSPMATPTSSVNPFSNNSMSRDQGNTQNTMNNGSFNISPQNVSYQPSSDQGSSSMYGSVSSNDMGGSSFNGPSAPSPSGDMGSSSFNGPSPSSPSSDSSNNNGGPSPASGPSAPSPSGDMGSSSFNGPSPSSPSSDSSNNNGGASPSSGPSAPSPSGDMGSSSFNGPSPSSPSDIGSPSPSMST
jgi:hypothetical protein